MVEKDIITIVLLGFVGGLAPGPVIFLSFSEILSSKKKGMHRALLYITVAAVTELCIGSFLIFTASSFQIPSMVFHFLAILGAILLFYISFQLFKIKKLHYHNTQHNRVSVGHIILLMLLNGPLWLFWTSVCLPLAFKLGNQINSGQYYFLFIFQFSMFLAMNLLLFSFFSFRNMFSNKKIARKVFVVLSLIMFLIACKVMYREIVFFF